MKGGGGGLLFYFYGGRIVAEVESFVVILFGEFRLFEWGAVEVSVC